MHLDAVFSFTCDAQQTNGQTDSCNDCCCRSNRITPSSWSLRSIKAWLLHTTPSLLLKVILWFRVFVAFAFRSKTAHSTNVRNNDERMMSVLYKYNHSTICLFTHRRPTMLFTFIDPRASAALRIETETTHRAVLYKHTN